MKTTITLEDEVSENTQQVTFEKSQYGVLIRPKGYGDLPSIDGEGSPILLDFFDGQLKLFVWSDINQEDPTHVINLSGALETNRVDI